MYLLSADKQKIISMLIEWIPSLEAIYLFGSYTAGSATEDSDVDLGYLSKEHLSEVSRWEISQKLATILNRDVDLVDMRETNTIFRHQILSTGERLYGGGYDVESFENLAYSFYLRFQEERKPIVDAIMREKKVLHGS